MLWPADKPIYQRPGAVLGGLAAAGALTVALIGRKKKEE
jgi:hypothetical protein